MTHTDFEVVNGRGLLVATCGDLPLARAWVKRNAALHDGLRVEEVTTTITRRRAYVPRVISFADHRSNIERSVA